MMIGARTGAWAKSSGGIPSGWVEVEWLKRNSEAYINTGVYVNRDIKTSVRFSYDGDRRYYQHPIGSSNYNGSTGSFGFYTAALESWSTTWVSLWNRRNIDMSWQEGVVYESSNDGNVFSLKADGVVVFGDFAVPKESSDFTYPNPISLFGILSDSGSITNVFNGRLYSAFLDDTRGEVRDFVPVRNATTNEGAMCDILTGEIYHNAGTGSFIVGPDKTT